MKRVALVGGKRTPFCRAGTALKKYSSLELGIHVAEATVAALQLNSSDIDEVNFSTVLLDSRTPNMARELVLRSSLSNDISAHFVSNNCISGLVSLNSIREGILSGRITSGLAGGTESMSQPPLSLSRAAERFFLSLNYARTTGAKLKALSGFRPGYLLPVPPSPKEPSTGLTMGQHCEITAKEFEIARLEQDEWAFRSHQAAARAQEKGYLTAEIAALGKADTDNFIRPTTTIEKLGSLKPVFDRSELGTLTAGNSSGLTDGASMVYVMEAEKAKAAGRSPLAFVDGVEFAAIDPSDGLLMAPALAVPRLLQKHGLTIDDIDFFEIHEAFAAQVISNRIAWEKGWKGEKAIGAIPDDKINVNGSSLAIGHPFAATGGRILLAAAHELQRSSKSKAVISVCAAGAMAAAVLLSRD